MPRVRVFNLLGSVGHLHGLHLLHHVLGCDTDAGGHVLDELCDPVHISLDVVVQRHGLRAWIGGRGHDFLAGGTFQKLQICSHNYFF